jgi:ATP-dependent protease ClpP protease subunit
MRNTRSPLYRFWGRTPPAENTERRAVVRAEVSSTNATEATLYLYGPIDSWGGFWGVSAAEVAGALSELPSGTTDLTLRINSPGGEVFEAVAIMNLLRDHSARITARVDGLAASAASFLAVSADETIMGGNTELMIHDAWGLAIGNASDMRQYADLLDRTSNDIASVYEAKAGGGVQAWRDYMLAESWFTAQEAVDLGLADSVNTGTDAEDSADPAARMTFDTETLFQHSGRATAPAPAPLPTAPDASADESAEQPPHSVTISTEHQADLDRRIKSRRRATELHAVGRGPQ